MDSKDQPAAVAKKRFALPEGKSIPNLLLDNALFIAMGIAIIYIAFRNSNFLTPASIINVVALSASSLPAALGIAGTIIIAGTDLSAGRIVGLTACVGASLLQVVGAPNKMWPGIGTLPIPVAILVIMLVGAAIGVFNGFFIAKFKLHPFIVTLATQLIVFTMLLLYIQMGNNNGMAISSLAPSYTNFVRGSILSIGGAAIPNFVWIAVVLTVITWFIWRKTVFGKNMFALGSNEEAARVSGVNVMATTIGVFALAGAMYSITGFIEGARIGSNNANTGFGYELDAIAACVIGGVSFVGGIGKIRGVILGVVMLRLIFVGLNMLSIDQNLQNAIKGFIILFACALDMRKFLVKK